MTTNQTDSLHDDLAAQLNELGGVCCDGGERNTYRVERLFKRSAVETTDLVWHRGVSGSDLGPFVRKRIDAASGLGGVYEEIFAAQSLGLRFAHLPRIFSCARSVDGRELVVLMDYIRGCTLREVIESAAAAQRLELAARLVPALCEAVDELHTALDAPIIHRDLTPGNVMCPTANPLDVVLIDLGIARSWHAGALTDTTHFGTRAYAPPEQYGFGQTDVRSDVYSLGLVAFFCLTGRDPLPSDREQGYADSDISPALRRVLVKATALDPSERHASVRVFGEAFERAVEEGPVQAEPVQPEAADRRRTSASIQNAASEGGKEWEAVALRKDGAACDSGGISGSHGNFDGGTSADTTMAPILRGTRRALGTAWNVLCLLSFALFGLGGCLYGLVSPSTQNPAPPLWLHVYEFLVFAPVLLGVITYALMSKRCLRAWAPWLAPRAGKGWLKPCLLVVAADFAALVVMIVIAQLTGY